MIETRVVRNENRASPKLLQHRRGNLSANGGASATMFTLMPVKASI